MKGTCVVLLVALLIVAAVTAGGLFSFASGLQHPDMNSISNNNKKKKSDSEERFAVTDEVTPTLRSAVVAAFMQTLGRQPTEYEITLYSAYVTDPNDLSMVLQYLRNTQEYKLTNQTSDTSVPSVPSAPTASVPPASSLTVAAASTSKPAYTPPTDAQLKTFKSIIDVFNAALDRMPTTSELDFYEARLTKGGLTLDGLRQLLEASNEYRILQKNQTNKVNAELPGNITDAQLVMDVREVYASVHGANVLPSQPMEDFLKAKYVEYSLSKPKLRSFLLLLQKLDSAPMSVEGDMPAAVCGDIRSSAATGGLANESSSAAQKGAQPAKTPAASPNASTTQSNGTGANGSQVSQQQGQATSTSGGSSASSCSRNSAWSYVYDEQYAILSQANGGSNGLPEKAQLCTQTAPRDPYAEAVFDRNMSEVSYACERNSLYSKKGNTLDGLGTPLNDAVKTQVGSIMPRFSYKEFSRDYMV